MPLRRYCDDLVPKGLLEAFFATTEEVRDPPTIQEDGLLEVAVDLDIDFGVDPNIHADQDNKFLLG